MSSPGAGHAETLPMPGSARLPRLGWISYAQQLTGLTGFFVAGLLVSPPCWILWKLSGGAFPVSLGQAWLRRCFRRYLKFLTLIGALDLDSRDLRRLRNLKGAIIACNHPSLLDAIYVLAHAPNAACGMRAGLLNNPLLAGGALLAGYVKNDSGAAFLKEATAKIQAGENLLVFPEGTRTRHQPVNPFKQGVALVAEKTGSPIHAVLIERRGNYLAKNVPLLAPAVLPMRIRLTLGETFSARPGETPRELTARLESWFRSRLHNNGTDVTTSLPS